MVNVVLYKYSGNNRKMNKKEFLEELATVKCSFKDSVSILYPKLVFAGDSSIIPYCNYLYIEAYKRFYYVTDIQNVNNMWIITCKIDVLYTYIKDISNSNALLIKSNEHSDLYYDDGSLRTDVRTFIETKEFDNGFLESPEIILITAGDKSAET